MNNDKFRRDIKRIIQKSKGKNELFFRKVMIDLSSRMILKSPVDTGRFRANWAFGNGSINLSTSEQTDLGGGATVAKFSAQIRGTPIIGQTLYATNSLPYAYRLEYEGWSQQAPQGFVRVTLAEMQSILNGAAIEVRGIGNLV